MSFKPAKSPIALVLEEDVLKETIKVLDKENGDLWSNLGKFAKEKEDLKINYDQKREKALQEEVQVEQKKNMKISEAFKGTFDNLATKKKHLADTQYQACKREISFQDQLKGL